MVELLPDWRRATTDPTAVFFRYAAEIFMYQMTNALALQK